MGWPAGWTIPREWRGKAYDVEPVNLTPSLGSQTVYVKVSRPHGPDGDGERWAEETVHPTASGLDHVADRAVALVASSVQASAGHHGHSSPRGDGGDNLVVASATGAGWWSEGDTSANLRAQPGGTPQHLVSALDTQRGGPDDNAAQAGHLVHDGLDSGRYLPDGLDSGRYRACGNGVIAPVAEWIGRRLAAYLEGDFA